MSLSLRHDFLASDESFSSASYLSTFVAGDCRPCRIHGQGTLIRLVDSSRYNPFAPSPGDYWTEASVFQRFMLDAAADLAAQNRAPNAALTGLYARFQLRDGLAVSRDWSNLDAYTARSSATSAGRLCSEKAFRAAHGGFRGRLLLPPDVKRFVRRS
jgi:hypothetical protein